MNFALTRIDEITASIDVWVKHEEILFRPFTRDKDADFKFDYLYFLSGVRYKDCLVSSIILMSMSINQLIS